LKAIVIVLAQFYLGWAVGRRLLRVLKIKADRGCEAAIIATGAGMWIQSLVMFLLGMAGWYKPVIILGVLAGGAVIFGFMDTAAYLRGRESGDVERPGTSGRTGEWWHTAGWLLIGISAAVNILRSFVPIVDFDSLFYHLAVPKIYLSAGTIEYIPTISLSNFPQMAEMLYVPSLAAGVPFGAALVHTVFGLMTAAMIFLWIKRAFSYSTALLSAAIFYLTPLVGLESPTGLIDLVATFYVTVAVSVFASNRNHDRGDRDSYILAALFGGIAVSVKWSCGLLLVMLFAWSGWEMLRAGSGGDWPDRLKRMRFMIGTLLVMSFMAVLPSVPYFVKNQLLAGNPVWPLMSGIFGGKEIDPLSAERLVSFVRGHAGIGHSFEHLLRLPWDITMKEWAFEGAISAVYLCFIPVYLTVRKNPLINFLLAFTMLYMVMWFYFLNLSLRFFLPVIPLMAVVAGYTVSNLSNRFIRIIAFTALFIHLSFSQATMFVGGSGLFEDLPVLLKRESRMDYVMRNIPETKLFKWIDENALDGERALLGEVLNKGFYLDTPYMWSHPVLQGRYRYDHMRDGDELLEILRDDSIKYIVFRMSEDEIYSPDLELPLLGEQGRRVWDEFLKDHTRVAYSAAGGVVLKVIDDGNESEN